MTDAELRAWIDGASYTQLLRRWRYGPPGPIFRGELGDYYIAVMKRRKAEGGAAAHTAASKAIGWEGS